MHHFLFHSCLLGGSRNVARTFSYAQQKVNAHLGHHKPNMAVFVFRITPKLRHRTQRRDPSSSGHGIKVRQRFDGGTHSCW